VRTPELKKTILRIIGKREFYGYEMHRELEERNIILGIGRLYSILTEMNDEGLLKDRWEKSSSGPKRRVYKIGKKGEIERSKILMDAIRTVHEFYMEYLLDLPPENSVFNIVGRILTRNVSESSNFGYIASRFSGPLMRIIGFLREKLPTGKKYAIAQQASELNLEFDDVFAVEGTFDDIPMKDNHLDLLVIANCNNNLIPGPNRNRRVY
jgi:DNA-binding PadR family transcriptional regulator